MTSIPPVNRPLLRATIETAQKWYGRAICAGGIGGAGSGAYLWHNKLSKESVKVGPPLKPWQYAYGGYCCAMLGTTAGIFSTAAFPLTAAWLSDPDHRSKLKKIFT